MGDPFSKTKVKSARGLTPKVDFWFGYRPGHIYLQTHMHLHVHEHEQSTNTQKGGQEGQKEEKNEGREERRNEGRGEGGREEERIGSLMIIGS